MTLNYFSDLQVVLSATHRGLEATFQWSHDSSYYLTAKTTGTPIVLEVSIRFPAKMDGPVGLPGLVYYKLSRDSRSNSGK